jgi:hypothetical protein
MILLLRIIFTAIALFFFTAFFLENFNDRNNAIVYKLYLFTFVFLLQIILNVFNNLFNKDKITLNSIMDTAVNNALLAVIAFDVYGDLTYQNILPSKDNKYHNITILVLLIIAFITTVKLLQLLLTQ